ncbi:MULTISPECIES: hypothetical protein [Burkholderia cepacia complex]|uniref:hypothetical protein n=1 Tax=Burkholderia cepacia complex TaxID=87882 RepID=UPI000B177549|nr:MULTISPECIES: hypothetical protein [Burkholderia cepacia complex]
MTHDFFAGGAVDLKTMRTLMRLAALGDRAFERAGAETYEEFVSVLYRDLDEIFQRLESSRPVYYKASEDAITTAIVHQLKMASYVANHDADNNGHCDLVVESRHNQKFKWLGEAKIDRGPTYDWGGWLQLTHRYSNAAPGSDHGGLLLYMRDEDAAKRLATWAQHLNDHGHLCTFEDANGRGILAFSTETKDPGSGTQYKIRHMAVSLFHQPIK